VIWIIWSSFKPEYTSLDSGVRKLIVHVAKSGKMKGEEWLTIIIFILVFLGWIFFSETVGLGIIALLGVFLYLITGVVNWSALSRNTNWGVIILFGATISLGYNINFSGASAWLADSFFRLFQQVIEIVPLFTDITVVAITTLLANVLSSSATVAVLGPITIHLGQDTMHLGLITAIASSFGYFTVIAAPACTIIYSSGLIQAKDFLKVGWKVGIFSMITSILYANTYWLLF
jgi:sodium-dependent dicarboxylate transporter 2/3/5